MSGAVLRDQLEGLEGLLRIGERIARAGDAEHRHLRNGGGDGQHLLRGLLGRQLLADDAGTRFVGAIIFAVAVVALDVAGRRHRHVHARIMMMRLFAVAGMVLDLLPNLGRQVALPGARTAARLAAAARRAAALVLGDLLHHVAHGDRRVRPFNCLRRSNIQRRHGFASFCRCKVACADSRLRRTDASLWRRDRNNHASASATE